MWKFANETANLQVVGIPANNKGYSTSSAIVGKDANNPVEFYLLIF
jgi:hypothetical protein